MGFGFCLFVAGMAVADDGVHWVNGRLGEASGREADNGAGTRGITPPSTGDAGLAGDKWRAESPFLER